MNKIPNIDELVAALNTDDTAVLERWLRSEVTRAILASPEYFTLQREMHEEELDILYGTNRHKPPKPVTSRVARGKPSREE